MTPLFRRSLLAGAAALPGVALAADDRSSTHLGPQDPADAALAPSSVMPPSTDIGNVPSFWFPFERGHTRVQEGGWARQVNVDDLPIAKSLAGVNMRLTAGGVRELHWHKPAEWSYMLAGSARITAVDADGRSFAADVAEGDLWYFPSGIPHSIQGLGPDGCEFLLVFDDGTFSEFDTFLLTDWLAHVPPEVLAKNFAMPASAFAPLPKHEKYIFQAAVPGSLPADQHLRGAQAVPSPFNFSLLQQPPRQGAGGTIRVADSRNFPASATIAAALVDVEPGGLRELHWHPNADEWQYYVSGNARMTVFPGGPKARTMDFQPGDVGYVPRSFGHYIENVGTGPLRFLEVFASSFYADVSLSDWLAHTPPELVAAHLNLDEATVARFPGGKRLVAKA